VLKIRHLADDGTLLVRDNVVFSLFMQAPLKDIAAPVRKAVETWLQEVPKDQIAWSTVGASATERKAVSPTTISRCLARLKNNATPRGNITYFSLQGPEEDNPAYRVELFAEHALQRTSRGILNSSFLEFRFPTEHFGSAGAGSMMDLAERLAAGIPYDSGYLSPGASWSYESDLHLARKIIGPLGLRYPGLDISFNASTCYQIDKRCRGPYWITFVGPHGLQQLGGAKTLRSSLPPAVTVREVGSGLMLVAGAQPVIGDRNRNDKADLLRSVAAVLEPVTFFGDKAIETYLFGDDYEKFARWDRRLLD
jgi:hypothetical protein